VRFNFAIDELMNLTKRTELCDGIYDLNENENENEHGLGPTQIVGQIFRNVLAANNNHPVPETPEEWTVFRHSCTWNGVTLNNWQM
jgi:hypothetical protein